MSLDTLIHFSSTNSIRIINERLLVFSKLLMISHSSPISLKLYWMTLFFSPINIIILTILECTVWAEDPLRLHGKNNNRPTQQNFSEEFHLLITTSISSAKRQMDLTAYHHSKKWLVVKPFCISTDVLFLSTMNFRLEISDFLMKLILISVPHTCLE